MRKFHFNTLVLMFWICLLANTQASGQCTVSAGTMNTSPVFFCLEEAAIVTHNADQLLEAGDVLGFILHDQAGAVLGNVIDTNVVAVFSFQAGMNPNTVYYISAVAGDDNGAGGVDLSDPCLSVSPGTPVTFSKPIITCLPPTINCINPTVVPDCTVQGASPFSFMWAGPGLSNPTLPAPTISLPGVYSVTVTDSHACTSTYEFVVVEDSTEPTVVISQTGVVCNGQPVILTASVQGSQNFSYQWNGPSGPVSTSAVLTVTNPGTYCVIVTDLNTGCTKEECVVVVQQPAINLSVSGDLTVPCPDQASGPIFAEVSGGVPPYAYIWSNGTTPAVLQGLFVGTYFLSVVDANGCTSSVTFEITSEILANAGPDAIINCQTHELVLDGSASNGSPPDATYLWRDPSGVVISTSVATTVTEPGIYSLEITNGTCTHLDEIVVSDSITLAVLLDREDCNSGTVYFSVSPNLTSYEYTWNTPAGTSSSNCCIPLAEETGYYSLSVQDPNSTCAASATEYFAFGVDACSFLQGRVVQDEGNCLVAGTEPGLGAWWLSISDGTDTYQTITDADGYYSIGLPVGNYTVSVVLPSPLWAFCQPSYPVSFTQLGTTQTLNIPVLAEALCPLMTVDITPGILRRCFPSNYQVYYCNEGTTTAEDATIEITLDPFLVFQNAFGVQLVSQNGQLLTFALGDIAPGQCGSFPMQVLVSCNSTLGQTHCTEAHIYPDTLCFSTNPLWSGASLAVNSACDGTNVTFQIANVGAGDMVQSSRFIIIEDGVMLMTVPDSVKLDAGETYELSFPANGATYRIEVDQAPYHPGESMPSLAVEGCGQSAGGGFSTGFVNQFSPDDNDPYLDIDCHPNVGSFDPNDKQAVPTGFGNEHFIRRNTDIEYTLRFQNTGTDTAFSVVITDTISPYLDLTSLQAGASSHPYRLEAHPGREIAFVFENILLPDSNVNLAGSQGFVRYRIKQLPELPLETVIENRAAIFFDFNDPVWTNTTTHRVGENFMDIVNGLSNPALKDVHISWSPNPVSQSATLAITGAGHYPDLKTLYLYDAAGRPLDRIDFSGQQLNWNAAAIASGFYYYKIYAGAVWLGSGKIAVAR